MKHPKITPKTTMLLLTVMMVATLASLPTLASPSHKYRDQNSTHNVYYISDKDTISGGQANSCGACTVFIRTKKPATTPLYSASSVSLVQHFHGSVTDAWSDCKWQFASGGYTGLTCYYYH